jgi:hypothetical protein
MGAHKRSSGRASEFAGAADKIAHFAKRIARGDTAYVREPMLDLIERCLLGNKEIIESARWKPTCCRRGEESGHYL